MPAPSDRLFFIDWDRLNDWADEADVPRRPGGAISDFVFRMSPVACRFVEPLLGDLADELEPAEYADADDTLLPNEPSRIVASLLGGNDAVVSFKPTLRDPADNLRVCSFSAGEDVVR